MEVTSVQADPTGEEQSQSCVPRQGMWLGDHTSASLEDKESEFSLSC